MNEILKHPFISAIIEFAIIILLSNFFYFFKNKKKKPMTKVNKDIITIDFVTGIFNEGGKCNDCVFVGNRCGKVDENKQPIAKCTATFRDDKKGGNYIDVKQAK
jgi:hypothetical protein